MIAVWSWSWPTYWPWLVVLALSCCIGWWRGLLARGRARLLLGPREHEVAGQESGVAGRLGLGALALSALLVALLQPVSPEPDDEPDEPSYVIALDVSWSMAAQDVAPSRLERAVSDLLQLAGIARGARVGLVAFSGDARLLVPLTPDLMALHGRADRLVPGAELLGGTNLGAAILAGVEALERADVDGGSVLVLTDGEDFSGTGRAAAERARERGIEVHCIGYGTEVGSKIAVAADGGQEYLRDDSGAEVVSALDPETLTMLATAGGGEFRLAGDDNPVIELHRGRLQERATAAAIRAGGVALAPQFQWPLLLALMLWMLALLVPERRR